MRLQFAHPSFSASVSTGLEAGLRRFILGLAVLAALVPAAAGQTDPANRPALMPYPRDVITRQGFHRLHNGFRAQLSGPEDRFARAAVDRFFDRLSAKSGIRFVAAHASDPEDALLRMSISEATPDWPALRNDESYRLRIAPEFIELSATNGYGLRHGLETLLQLLEVRELGIGFPVIQIQDQPRFPWRGLMIDPVRHFLPVAELRRQIDAMAGVKLNVLHLHLTNDQGFRVESKRFPKLHEAGGEGQYYSQAELREIVDYARWRGIRVVPEFGVPGHTAGWLVGYPELGSRPGPYTPVRSFGIFEPTMDPTNEKLYPFLDEFYGEMASIFPDPFVHIGGDEITGKHWLESPNIKAFMEQEQLKTPADLHAWFNRRLIPILEKHGKRAIGWDEVLHPDLPRTVMVQSWRGPESLAEAARNGHQGILSNGYYLDLMLSAASHYSPDPLAGTDSPLSPEERARILGGEACIWAEFVSAENIGLKLWPRLGAVAERLWSDGSLRDEEFLYLRLPKLLDDLLHIGIDPRQTRRAMLQRAVGNRAEAESLMAASEWMAPVERYYRADSGDYTVFTPLNRLVDALWPESLVARQLSRQIQESMAPNRTEILGEVETSLREAAKQSARLVEACHRSALLADGASVMEEVSAAAKLGAEAAHYLRMKRQPPEGWKQAARRDLGLWQSRRGEIRNLLVDPVKSLVNAAVQTPTP